MQKVHGDASQHSGCVAQNPDAKIAERDGNGHEGRDQSHAEDEQANEASGNTENHDGV